MVRAGGIRLHVPRPLRAIPLAALLALPALAALPLPPAEDDPALVGRWVGPYEGYVAAVNMALLPNGKVLYYSGVEADESDAALEATFFTSTPLHGKTAVFDPVALTVLVLDRDAAGARDLFCSGTTILGDGRVLAAGGSEWFTLPDSGSPVKGAKDARFFDADTNAWSFGPEMSVRRWYPSVIQLPDGRALVASGIKNLSDPSTHNSVVEVLGPNGWEALAPPSTSGDVEHALMNLPMYPRLLAVPGGPFAGDVFYSTVGTLWGPFGERPEEVMWSLQQTLDVDTGAWTFVGPSVFGARQHAAVVPLLLDPARGYAPELLTFGGTLQRSVVATPLAEVADLAHDPPKNSAVAPMSHGRWHLNGVLAPDGTVFAIGGAAYDNVVVHGQEDPGVLPAERFDPETGAWETLASMSVARGYHSTAVVLPDGRILAGGHVPLPNPFPAARATLNPQTVETRLEILEPPYLFLDDAASRPVLSGVPTGATWGASVTFPVANLEQGLHSVVLMRPGATTHSFDADQRGILLAAVDNGDGTVTVTMPPSADVAPPGHWMLFVNEDVDGQAFPSIASFVRLS